MLVKPTLTSRKRLELASQTFFSLHKSDRKGNERMKTFTHLGFLMFLQICLFFSPHHGPFFRRPVKSSQTE